MHKTATVLITATGGIL